MGSPALTLAASAVFVTARLGQLTVMDAEACAVPSLDVVTVAVLLTVPHVLVVVGDVMWTCLLRPAPSVPNEHVSAPLEMTHPVSEPPTSMVQDVPLFVGRVSET